MIYPCHLDNPPTEFYGDLADITWPTRLEFENPADDNLARAGWAAVAVVAMGQVTFGDSNEDAETAISDLLGNLRHLCDALGLDFAKQDDRGRNHYLGELAGE